MEYELIAVTRSNDFSFLLSHFIYLFIDFSKLNLLLLIKTNKSEHMEKEK